MKVVSTPTWPLPLISGFRAPHTGCGTSYPGLSKLHPLQKRVEEGKASPVLHVCGALNWVFSEISHDPYCQPFLWETHPCPRYLSGYGGWGGDGTEDTWQLGNKK